MSITASKPDYRMNVNLNVRRDLLDGLRCPECGHEDRFIIRLYTLAAVAYGSSCSVDQGEEVLDHGDASYCRCDKCEHTSTISEFKRDNQVELRAHCKKCHYQWRSKEGTWPRACPRCRTRPKDISPYNYVYSIAQRHWGGEKSPFKRNDWVVTHEKSEAVRVRHEEPNEEGGLIGVWWTQEDGTKHVGYVHPDFVRHAEKNERRRK